MNLKDKKYHANFEKVNRELEINCESLSFMIITACKTNSDAEVYRRYANLSEKIDKCIRDKEFRSLYSNLVEFIDSIKDRDAFKDDKVIGFLILLLLNIQKLAINSTLLEVEKISYCFPALEKTTDSFLEGISSQSDLDFMTSLSSFHENLNINLRANKDEFMSGALEATIKTIQFHLRYIENVKTYTIELEKGLKVSKIVGF